LIVERGLATWVAGCLVLTVSPAAVAAPAEPGPAVSTPSPVEGPESAEEFDGDSAEDESFEFDPLRDSPEAVNARRLRGTGVALMLVGLVVGAGALAIGLGDPCAPSAGNDCRMTTRRNAAIGMGVPGAAVFTAGVVTFAIGQHRLRRLRLSIAPHPTGGALGISGRF
jgi:hypothetical protein